MVSHLLPLHLQGQGQSGCGTETEGRITYFFQLAVIEYGELLFYRDRTRSAVMWPKVSICPLLVSGRLMRQIKALACLVGYTIVEPSDEDPIYVSTTISTL